MKEQNGVLYIVATPIGNLEDITLRALRILKEVELIGAEDTRNTKRLLNHYQINTPLTSYHQHSKSGKTDVILNMLAEGKSVAIVTDGGTPGISDPGGILAEAAHLAGYPVCPIPGASSLTAALSVAGMHAQRFHFLGFLPVKSGERKRALLKYVEDQETLVIFESPYRVRKTLKEAYETLGDRNVCLCREITKVFEEIRRSSLKEVSDNIEGTSEKGEYVIIISGKRKKE